MAPQPNVMRTPKSYWRTRRSEGHSDWAFGFWRELFQNENDAGADEIDISVGAAPGKGSFGREATVDAVTRVVFTGNGRGMDEDVLRNVFLVPGETTKRNGVDTGGFGTARIMLAFSQVRYGIQTQKWVVEGDGSEYTCMSLDEALAAKREEIDTAVAAGAVNHADMLRADMAALEARPAVIKGCRMEIDIDPKETPYSYLNVDQSKLLTKLEEYLSYSQMSCKVRLNGEEMALRTHKGPAKRLLVVRDSDGKEIPFATVHTSLGDRAKHKGKLIVRVNGAAMYVEESETREQVIVELVPGLSRQILTDNRDGMKAPYRGVLSAFLRELAVDVRSALEDKEKRKHIKIAGGKGPIVAQLDTPPIDMGANGTVVAAVESSSKAAKARFTTTEEYELRGFGGAPREALESLIQAIERGEDTFVGRIGTDIGREKETNAFIGAVLDGHGVSALGELGQAAASAVAGTLTARSKEAKASVFNDGQRFAESHDIHIQIEDLGDNERLKTAVRRYSPSYWRRKGESLEGRGMEAHMLLAAFTACCQEAVETLLKIRPDAGKKGKIEFGTGFLFQNAKEQWNGEKTAPLARHLVSDNTHLFLLNPVTNDGQPAYDIGKVRRENARDPVMGIQDIEASAIHEVAHFFSDYHDEDFASLLSALSSMFDRTRAHERMRESVNACREVYGRGKTRIQSMDETVSPGLGLEEKDEKSVKGRKPRPAEVILAQSVPLVTMVAGAVAAPENEHLESAAFKMLVASAVNEVAPGVTEIDADRLQGLEKNLAALSKNDWSLDNLAIPGLDELLPIDAPMPDYSRPMDLGAFNLPPLEDILPMDAPSSEAAPQKREPKPIAVPTPARSPATRPQNPNREVAVRTADPAPADVMAALAAMSGQLSAMGPSAQIVAPTAPPVAAAKPAAEDALSRGQKLVGEAFDMDAFGDEDSVPEPTPF
jgi:hypothetical protein